MTEQSINGKPTNETLRRKIDDVLTAAFGWHNWTWDRSARADLTSQERALFDAVSALICEVHTGDRIPGACVFRTERDWSTGRY